MQHGLMPCVFLDHASLPESRIPYEVLYYCYAVPNGTAAEIAFMVSLDPSATGIT